MVSSALGENSEWITLEKYIEKNGILSFRDAISILDLIYKDIQELHKKGSCHGAVTLKDILVREQIWSCCRLTGEAQMQRLKEEWEAAPIMLTGAVKALSESGLKAELPDRAREVLLQAIRQKNDTGYDGIRQFWECALCTQQEESILMAGEFSKDKPGLLRDSGIKRDEVKTITFVDSLAKAPKEAWDVSEKRNRSVLAWAEGETGAYDLYIAGNKKVIANPNCGKLFKSYTNLKQMKGMGLLDTSRVTDMNTMFKWCKNLTELDVSGFDTRRVTNMGNMFGGCKGLTELDVSGFDTGRVTNMGNMFGGCKGLTELDVRGFDTGRVIDMSNMFNGCENLTKVDVSGFDTSQVTDMSNMFGSCKSLTELNVSGFDTSRVTNMMNMFGGCKSLIELDVSGFDTSQVAYMVCMFSNCKGLTQLDVSGFNVSQVTHMSYMFSGCENLTKLDVSGFDISRIKDADGIFTGCQSLLLAEASGSSRK